MQQILIGVILILGMASYYFYSQNQILQANNLALEGAVATQEEAIAKRKIGNTSLAIIDLQEDHQAIPW